LLPEDAPPLRHDTEQFFRLRGALLLAKCAVSTAAVTPPDQPVHADGSMMVEADLADLLGDLSEVQMVALESPNAWLRRGERERASGGSKIAHPGGAISSNKAEATAAFYLAHRPPRAVRQRCRRRSLRAASTRRGTLLNSDGCPCGSSPCHAGHVHPLPGRVRRARPDLRLPRRPLIAKVRFAHA
jgi:hypothetical protein